MQAARRTLAAFLFAALLAPLSASAEPGVSSTPASPAAPAPSSPTPPAAPAPSPAPTAATTTPPSIDTFVEAEYPEAARASGREATVGLELTVTETGNVRDARVIEPAGDGFDEAALAAVRQFVFKPALRDGRPIAVRIRFQYAFARPDAPDTGGAAPDGSELQAS